MKTKLFLRARGFTLVELVVVIVILAILAAIGVPQFITMGTEARTASVNGMAGATRAAVLLSRAKYKVSGRTSPIEMDGTSVEVTDDGIPCADATGIGAALFSQEGFTLGSTRGRACRGNATVSIQPTDGGSTTCQLTYDEDRGVVTVVSTGC
jgi:MSHA pilin protein MshA